MQDGLRRRRAATSRLAILPPPERGGLTRNSDQPQNDHVFVDIAKQLGQCQFVFFIPEKKQLSDRMKARLTRQFAEAGLNADSFCVFIPWLTKPQFYGLMQQADVFLDTIGFSGFNTASQAVECALPIVTREGRFLRGRLASAILKRIRLSELVAADAQAYVALAVKLVQDHAYHADIKRPIKDHQSLLFQDMEVVRAFELFLQRVAGFHL